MFIKFLGVATGLPELKQKHSAIYVKKEEFRFLLDCGEGISQAFLEERIEADELDFIFISHTHPDHFVGLFMLLQMFALKKRSKDLTIYLPEKTTDFIHFLNYMYLFPEQFPFALITKRCDQISQDFDWMNVFLTNHLDHHQNWILANNLSNQHHSYAIRMLINQKSVVYTSDLSSFIPLFENLQNVHICITNGSQPPPPEFIDLTKIIQEKIYLTHGVKEGVKSLIFGSGKFEIAKEKMVIPVI